jgi:hypothetical protein
MGWPVWIIGHDVGVNDTQDFSTWGEQMVSQLKKPVWVTTKVIVNNQFGPRHCYSFM